MGLSQEVQSDCLADELWVFLILFMFLKHFLNVFNEYILKSEKYFLILDFSVYRLIYINQET